MLRYFDPKQMLQIDFISWFLYAKISLIMQQEDPQINILKMINEHFADKHHQMQETRSICFWPK